MEKKKGGSADFGKKGWIVVIISMFYWLLGSSLTSDGLNTILPHLMEKFGSSRTSLALFSTLGGWISTIGIIVFGSLAMKMGSKKIIMISGIGGIIACLIMGYGGSPLVWGLGLILYFVMISGMNGIAVQNIGAEWFPTKKGMFMGISTMGITLGACTINLFLNATLVRGLHVSMIGWSILIVLVLLATQFFVTNTPEESGAYPDNDKSMTKEKVAELQKIAEEYRKTSPWTVKKVLTYKTTWLIIVGWGMMMMCAGGILAQVVSAFVSYGHDPMQAIWCFTYLFPVGFFCSWLGGLIDSKFGTRAGSVFSAALLILGAGVILLFGKNLIACIIGTALFMGAMSAANNMTMSITTSVWGRYDFPNAWRVISVGTKIVTSAGVVLMSLMADKTGSYAGAFWAMLISAVISIVIILITDEHCVGRTDEELLAKK